MDAIFFKTQIRTAAEPDVWTDVGLTAGRVTPGAGDTPSFHSKAEAHDWLTSREPEIRPLCAKAVWTGRIIETNAPPTPALDRGDYRRPPTELEQLKSDPHAIVQALARSDRRHIGYPRPHLLAGSLKTEYQQHYDDAGGDAPYLAWDDARERIRRAGAPA